MIPLVENKSSSIYRIIAYLNINVLPKIRDGMKEGGGNVTSYNFREELHLFYLRDRGRMNRFDGVRAENSVIIQKKDIF